MTDNVRDIGGGEVVKWADPAMYEAEEMPGKDHHNVGVITPSVTLLGMTADPLGHIAAMCAIYKGEIRRSLQEVTHEERRYYLEQMQKTVLSLPLELVNFHFFYEGVTRALTHQQVRTRVGVGFAQESMRFAVKEHVDEEVALPPSLAGLRPDDPKRVLWQQAVNKIDDTYHALIAAGVPAEDARGLLPTNITTRIHQHVNLRTLLEVAGQRLCTQAQFEWRVVLTQLARSVREYNPHAAAIRQARNLGDESGAVLLEHLAASDSWQYEAIADLLRPVCYQRGKCGFGAEFDRKCRIRERVQIRSRHSYPEVDSSQWHKKFLYQDPETGEITASEGIHPAEWLADPGAAR